MPAVLSEPSQASPAAAGVRVIVDDAGWRRAVRRVEAVAGRALRATHIPASVVLTNDLTVRRLNARHRGRNKPTNVLTFSAPSPALPGELVLALGTVRREALAARRRVADHLAHLVVHGALHLGGHDHEAAGQARRMEMAEARLLGRLGAGNPWRPR